MELNELKKDKYRKKIIEMTKSISCNQKIQVNKELLEQLLFDELKIYKDKIITKKIPVWSGTFLQNIDLSEVNFDNVSWESNVYTHKVIKIDYSYTNANIDLTKSFDAINSNEIRISDCNFEGVNFKDINGIKSLTFLDCNLSNSNLIIPKDILLYGTSSNLSNLDLSNYSINGNESLYYNNLSNLGACCLKNTGIRINFDFDKYKKEIKFDPDYILIKESLTNNWIGCYVNGKEINRYDGNNFKNELTSIKKLIKYKF